MAQEHIYTQVYLAPNTGLPRDRFINVWSFGVPDTYTLADITSIHTALQAFYVARSTPMIASTFTANSGHTIKSYNRADVKPRAPLLTTTFSNTPSTNDPLPPEVAMCLSFKGDPLSGFPRARQRGRVYFGPLTENCFSGGIWTSAIRTAVLNDLVTMNHAVAAIGSNFFHEVWSPTQNNYTKVTQYWIDDEADHQKRRQRPASSRSTATP